MEVRKGFKHYTRVLIKVGTSVVTQPDGTFALDRCGHLVEEIYKLMKSGKQVALVSSGSVGQGRQILRKQALLSTPLSKHIAHHDGDHLPSFRPRACAAAGQSGMMAFYESLFSKKGLFCSQVLLLDDDFRLKKAHIKETLTDLMECGIIPIINENDVMSLRKTPLTDETGAIFWDNDSLAALIAKELGMELMLLLTDVAGIFDQDPRNDGARIINVFRGVKEIVVGPQSRVGRGGMKSKIEAAISATDGGVQAVVIASGCERNTISRIINGENVGTLFSQATSVEDELTPTEKAIAAKQASHTLRGLTGDQRSLILREIANQMDLQRRKILDANEKDLREARRVNLDAPLVARLKLTPEKLSGLTEGIKQLADSPDPVGEVTSRTKVAEGLYLTKEATPIGLVLVIFESRPDAIPQLASLAIRSGNALILKGGKEANATNKALHNVITYAISLASRDFPTPVAEDVLALVESRDEISSLLQLDDLISLVIPRGSSSLVKHIQTVSKIPVLGHAAGICHIYVHEDADVDKAIRLILDSKLDYPAACNAVETVLLHHSLVADGRAAQITSALHGNGAVVYAPTELMPHLPYSLELANSFRHEYSSPSLTITVVEDVKAAIKHINRFGSGHTESIITESAPVAKAFLDGVDSACVFHNASTRFADGYRFGLGAEVGISTSRIHARGPVGVDGLMSMKWKLVSTNSDGDIVKEYTDKIKPYLHEKLPVAKL
eukprot:TRINITY_DN11300_c0_g1_i1.p1 TRINITY_DN11300_c0_g1~~TRINITY_DN11300_c0_g1_i1.p1  ORF type:complete len:728 (-),score=141.43 TRINITY_DN11300_c0_g1_i1:36-2219(-)